MAAESASIRPMLQAVGNGFDVVRIELEESAGPDLVRAVEELTLDQVDSLAESILSLPRCKRLPERPTTEIWPLVPLRASLFFDHLNNESVATDYAPSGIRLSAATDPRASGTGEFSAGIIRALLYSHGLVIEDPLSHAAEMHVAQHRELREVTRTGISAAVASLSEIAPLLDQDVVTTFYTGGEEIEAADDLGDDMLTALDAEGAPYSVQDAWDEFESEFVTGLPPPLLSLWTEIRGGNRSPDPALVQQAVDGGYSLLTETFIDAVSILNPRSIVGNAIASTASTVALIRMLGGSCDVLCATPLMERLLFLGSPDPVQQLRVQEIARTSVPNIDVLSPNDLVSIRQASEALARWRHDLAEAIDYAERLRRSGNDPRTIQRSVSEHLADARGQLQKEARRSRVWRSENFVSFVAGGLGGVGGALVDGTGRTIAAGAGTGVIAAFVSAVGQRRSVPGFLDRHYVAFARPTSDSAAPEI